MDTSFPLPIPAQFSFLGDSNGLLQRHVNQHNFRVGFSQPSTAPSFEYKYAQITEAPPTNKLVLPSAEKLLYGRRCQLVPCCDFSAPCQIRVIGKASSKTPSFSTSKRGLSVMCLPSKENYLVPIAFTPESCSRLLLHLAKQNQSVSVTHNKRAGLVMWTSGGDGIFADG
jgi:hypothetical protein